MEVHIACKANMDEGGQGQLGKVQLWAINQVLNEGNQIMSTEWKWRQGPISSFDAAH